MLLERDATARAYDPTAAGELNTLRRERLVGFELESSALSAVEGADVVDVVTERPEFAALDTVQITKDMRNVSVVDCQTALDRAPGLSYDGVGRR